MKDLLQKVQAMSEASMTRVNVDAAVFHGDINEAFNSFNIMIAEDMNESAAFHAFTSQLILEAAVAYPERYEAVNEGVVSNFIEGVKKFFKNMVAFVKGIIEKIRVMIVSQMGNVKEWEKVVLPKVEKNAQDSKIKDNFTYNGRDWKGLDQIDKLMPAQGEADLKTSADKFKTYAATWKEQVKNAITKSPAAEIEVAEDTKEETEGRKRAFLTHADLTACDATVSVDRNKDKIKEEVMKSYNKAKDIATYLRDAVKEIRTEEKVEISRFNKGPAITTMIDFIKGSKERLEKMADGFDTMKDKYDAIVSVLEDIDTEVDKDGMKNTQSRMNIDARITAFKEVLELKKFDVSLRQSAYNEVYSKQRSLIQEGTKEFMTILGAFANAKAPKA